MVISCTKTGNWRYLNTISLINKETKESLQIWSEIRQIFATIKPQTVLLTFHSVQKEQTKSLLDSFKIFTQIFGDKRLTATK